MKRINHSLKALGLGLCLSSAYFPVAVNADLAAETMANFTQLPIVSADSATPMVMIAASNDHQLFFKAYNDYTDLDHDGIPETTYKHSFDYYGYFDRNTCYNHNGSMFVPASTTANKYCSGNWSGNFLNWATMTRIDTVRKILFGGLRSVDTATDTVLERTYLPNDAHSFAKYYNGNDINQLTPFSPPTADPDAKKNGITICNTTVNNTSEVSEDVTDPPLMRVATGNFSLWASNERWQCRWSGEKGASNANDPASSGIDAYASNPDKGTYGLGNDDYIVRVRACVSGLREDNCKRYPDGNYKPTGLLQVYGDEDKILFGMMAGSYLKNKSGGVVIKDISSMSNEIDVAGNGRFIDAVTSGQATNQADGIINAWSLYRVVKYQHGDGTYGTSGVNNNNCTWGINSFNDGQCQNWGNPFAEIYWNAIRYMAGEAPTGTYRSNGSPIISGLETPNTWSCPLDDTNYCSSLNVIAFNASTISYDDDQLDGTSDGVGSIWSGANSSVLTDIVGAGEGIHGNAFFIGENGVDNNGLCTQKTINSLGAAKGLCPEAPRLDGTYRIAGIAYKAHLDDIRSSGPNELEDDQLVDTYAVTLAPAVPEITVPVPGSSTGQVVKILPACRNESVGGNCAIVDFKIVEPHTEVGNVGYGKFYVNWEDSEQGGDYDQDMWGVLSYVIDSGTNTITVETDTLAQSTPYAMGFGYVISGTTTDGFHVHSGINNFIRSEAGITDCNSPACQTGDAPTSHTYALGTSSAGLLKDPLYYAAKWGAFQDENGNNIPDLQTEWDRKDQAGNLNPDGMPDTYYYATNPEELETSLANVFDAIIAKTASGTAASVVASSRQGQGTVVQALYVTERTYDSKTVKWVGTLHGLWVDNLGLIREDTNGDGELGNYQTDHVVNIYYDSGTRHTRVCRFDSLDADTYTPVILNAGADCEANSLPLEELGTLWNAREQLSSLDSASITTQRSYSSEADNGRHILTWVDANRNGEVDNNEFVPFTPSGINTTSRYGYLNALSQTEADGIINYIRGAEDPAMRNRTIDFDGDGTEEVMRLGDIVHSTPSSVSTPAEGFHLLHGDTSYAAFRRQYANRRHMIYVGANDGLLHAFNGGFFDPVNVKFTTSTSNGETAHPLGSELWAYAPGNLLPHLKWLTDPDYTHVYYMDAPPRIFDVKIFSPDSTHPGGWGTILVAGMRFGGGTMTVDTAQNGLGGANAADDHEFRSAYVVLDITDPEQPPNLLAEITDPALGFTTSYPTAIIIRENDDSLNNWYLVFGTGPTNATSATSTQDGRLLVYDLVAKDWATNFGPTDSFNVVGADSFVSDPLAADWDLDFKGDDLYVGTVNGTPSAPGGSLWRLKVDGDADPNTWGPSTWAFEERLSTNQPIVMRPTLSIDERRNHWVFAGTGRFFVNDDKTSDTQQTLYGFRDNPSSSDSSALPSTSNLVDVTNAVISTDDTTSPPYQVAGVSVTGFSIQTFPDLEAVFDATGSNWKDGWKIDLDLPTVSGEPSTRMVKEGALLANVLLMPDFTPSVNLCGGDGNSKLFGLYYKTGTPLAEHPIFGSNASNQAIREVDLGEGLASAPSLHVTNNPPENSGERETAIIQNSRGDIITQEAELPTPVRSGEMSWREQYE
jgi:type IV pilus assembly protein PilY1